MIYLDNNNRITLNDVNFWENEKKFWNNYGKIYRHLEAATPYKRMLADIAALISKKNYMVWLDAGCGPGTMIDLIIKNQSSFNEIIGIDFDGVMLDQATERLKNDNRIKIIRGDLSKPLNFKDNYFNAVIANLVLSYVIIFDQKFVGPDALKELLREMYRILDVGGQFLWTTPTEKVDFTKVFFASWRQVFNPLTPKYIYYGPKVLSYALKIQRKGRAGLYHFYNQNQIESLMKNIGFMNIKIKKTFAGQSYLISAEK